MSGRHMPVSNRLFARMAAQDGCHPHLVSSAIGLTCYMQVGPLPSYYDYYRAALAALTLCQGR